MRIEALPCVFGKRLVMLCCGKTPKKGRLQQMAHSDSRPEDLRRSPRLSPHSRGPHAQQVGAGRSALSEHSAAQPSAHRSPRSSPRKPRKGGANVEMGVKNTEIQVDSSVMQTVEILKRPGQSLGFYIREGNGYDQNEGVFISRIAPGSVVESNGLLRVGDEILTINSVDVSRMSLDDVVILMSIPKRLVLNIRTRKNNKNASCPSLANIQPAEEPPVVVFKNRCRANSSSAVEMTEKCPDEFGLAGSNVDYKYYSDHSPYSTYKAPSQRSPNTGYAKSIGYERQYTPDDSGDSGLSSENSGCSVPGKEQQKLISPGDTPQDRLASMLDVKQYEIDGRNYLTRISPREAAPKPAPHQHSPVVKRRNPYVHMDYSSDPDAASRFTHMRSASDVPGFKPTTRGVYDHAAIRAFQDEIERTHHRYESAQGKQSKLLAKIRHLSPDRYNSDSEVVTHRTKELMSLEHQQMQLSHLLNTDDRCNSLPHMQPAGGGGGGGGQDIKQWLHKFDSLALDTHSKPAHVPSGYATTTAAVGVSSRPGRETFTSEEYQNWISAQLGGGPLPSHTSQYSQPRPDMTFPRQHPGRVPQYTQAPVNHGRVTRKHSADSLMDYRTYQLEDDSSGSSAHSTMMSNHRSHKLSTGNLSDVGTSVTTSSNKSGRSQKYSVDAEGRGIPSPATRLKDLQLARKPLQIRTEDFKPYQPDTEDRKAKYEKSLDGLLTIHVLCGHGLKSSRTMLRDLYCVIETDGVNKARTMIRTGAINFDWDEAFEVDLETARELSFQVYSWDPNTRHRLCYSSTVGIHNLIQTKSHKIALKLEPKGILYLALQYHEPAMALQRTPSMRRHALFGAELDSVVMAEKSKDQIPLVVKKCIEEVELRGMDHVGIYRLCGSAKRKAQLKQEFEKNAKTVDIGYQTVSDINVVTGVLKDFFRELPEPLFTNSLYQMLVDALSVRMATDPDGSAKLMLNILECLPKANQVTLHYTLDHLKRVSSKSELNKMTTANLAVCFGPILLCPAPTPGGQPSPPQPLDLKKHTEVLKYLLDIWPECREPGLPVSSETLVSSAHSSTSTIKTVDSNGSTVRHAKDVRDVEVSSC